MKPIETSHDKSKLGYISFSNVELVNDDDKYLQCLTGMRSGLDPYCRCCKSVCSWMHRPPTLSRLVLSRCGGRLEMYLNNLNSDIFCLISERRWVKQFEREVLPVITCSWLERRVSLCTTWSLAKQKALPCHRKIWEVTSEQQPRWRGRGRKWRNKLDRSNFIFIPLGAWTCCNINVLSSESAEYTFRLNVMKIQSVEAVRTMAAPKTASIRKRLGSNPWFLSSDVELPTG